jgi:WD40 repeat protein
MNPKYLQAVFLLLTFSFLFAPKAFAQTECQPPPITANSNAFNIFSEQQEMYLGDAMAERFRKYYRVIDDEQVNAYLQKIGERLIKHLPQSNIKFQFVVADLPEANAYASAGGRIYVTRKLIAFVRSEDELAGVLAHELGHGTVRHLAIDTSKYFKEILGVTTIGDRRDILEKYNLMIEKRLTKKVSFSSSHEDNQQLEADRIGIFAATAAGYDPNGFISFLDRLTDSKGKTGNFLTDIFGATKPGQKRLREMIEALKTLPAACVEKRPVTATNQDFEKWRAFVVAYSGLGGKERLNALVSRKNLAPPLRADVVHLRFSPNGEFILAQDDSGISVLKREPFSLLFRIEAPEVKNAGFTPDSKHIVFYNTALRVQKWSLAEKSLVSVHEVVLRRGCWQTALSPDGKTLACFNYWGEMGLYDVATNENIFLEKQFYLPNSLEYFVWSLILEFGNDEVEAVNLRFSPDARYFLAGHREANFLVGGLPSSSSLSRTETLAVDLQTKKSVSLGGNIKKLVTYPFTFYAPDKLIGQIDKDGEESGIFSFPEGERLDKMLLRGRTFTKPEQGDYVMTRPVSNAPVGLFDIKTKKYILANKTSALDVYGDYFVSERRNGELGLYKMNKGEKISVESVAVLELPPNQFGLLRTVGLSPDGKWLAASEKSRGAVWNLETGARVIYLRGFRGSHFAENNSIYADFPKNDQTERSLAIMNPNTGAVEPSNQIEEKSLQQFGQFLVTFKRNKEASEGEAKRAKELEQRTLPFEERVESVGVRNVTMEVRDAQSNEILWTRRFDEERPAYNFSKAHGTLVLIWALKAKAAKNIIKTDAALSAKLLAMQEKDGDYFIQILDPKNGKVTGQFLLETGEGSFYIQNAFASGDNLVIADSANRILVYSVAQGTLRQRFFGSYPTINPAGNLIAIENEPGRLTIYDLNSGAEVEKLYFGVPISYAEFNADGKRLFVLTANQTAFTFDATKLASQAANSVK